jgi:hypothetical protein
MSGERKSGKNGAVYLAPSAGGESVQVGTVHKWTLTKTYRMLDVTRFGDPHEINVRGHAKISGTLTARWTTDAQTIVQAAESDDAVAIALFIDVADTAPYWSGPVLFSDVDVEVDVAGAVRLTASFEPGRAESLITPPGVPSTPSPATLTTFVALAPTLSWAPMAGATSYSVHLGLGGSLPTVSAGQVGTSYTPATLLEGHRYFWYVTAFNAGGSTTGPIWEFTTHPLPAVPSVPAPSSGGTAHLAPTLTWAAANVATHGATTYDVYFGTANPPPLVSTAQSAASYTPTPPLFATTVYYWKVVATNAVGTTAGPVWSFTATPVVPASAPTLALSAGIGLDAGAYQYAVTFGTAAGESLPSAPSSITVVDVTAPTAPSVAKALGGNLSAGVYQWKVAYLTAAGETLASVASAAVTMDDVAAPTTIGVASATSESGASGLDSGANYSYRYVFTDDVVSTLPSPASNTFTTDAGNLGGRMTFSGLQTAPGGFRRQFYRTEGGGAIYKRMNGPAARGGFEAESADSYRDTGFYAQDNTLGPAVPPTVSTAIYRSATLTIPVSADPLVTQRRIYRTDAGGSTFKKVADVANNTATSYLDTLADVSLGATPPATSTATPRQVAVTAIAIGPSGTTSRKIYRTVVAGSQLKLHTTIANNTATTITPDVIADGSLGANAPTVDTSGL